MEDFIKAYEKYMGTGSKKDFNILVEITKKLGLSEDDFLKAAGYNKEQNYSVSSGKRAQKKITLRKV